jgi:ribosomal protein S18 acetylase RimI-like enzyme
MITIRELRPDDDLAAVLGLCKVFFDEYESFHEDFFNTDNLSDDDISGRFLESLTSDSSATIIALDDDRVVGYALIAVREQPRFYKVKKVGAVSGLMVAKSHRRRGIASLLLKEVKAFFHRQGVRYFTLYTSVVNEGAIEFYKRNGLTALHASFIGEA